MQFKCNPNAYEHLIPAVREKGIHNAEMIGFRAKLGSLLRYLGIDLPDEGIWSEFTGVLSTKAFLRGKKALECSTGLKIAFISYFKVERKLKTDTGATFLW